MCELKGSLTRTDFRAMVATWVVLVSDQSGGPIRKQGFSRPSVGLCVNNKDNNSKPATIGNLPTLVDFRISAYSLQENDCSKASQISIV
jgi:hypothetical protein